MGFLIFAGILFLLAILPLGAQVNYDADGPVVKIIAGPIRIQVFPLKKKEKKEKKEKKKKPAKPSKPAPAKKEKPAAQKEKTSLGGTIEKFWPFVKMGLDFLGDLRRKIRLNVLHVSLTMAGDDPCDLAVNYGRAWTAVGNLVPMLERAFVIQKKDIRVACDFEAEKTLIVARLDITITLGRIVALVVRYGVRALILLIKLKKSTKKVESV